MSSDEKDWGVVFALTLAFVAFLMVMLWVLTQYLSVLAECPK